MLLHRLATTSVAVTAASARNEKVRLLGETIADLSPSEVAPAVSFLSGSIRQGRIGVGWATASRLTADLADSPTLTVGELDAAFDQLSQISGPGSVAARDEVLRSLLTRSTEVELEFVRRLIVGEVRQGALAGVVTAAVVAATKIRAERGSGEAVKLADLRRAAMLLGDLPTAASSALGPDAVEALATVGLSVMRGVEPMLAATSTGAAAAIADVGEASVEWKLDGARVQIHRSGDQVLILTRNLNDVTDRLPEVVSIVRSLPVDTVILDGEVLGLDADAAPRPFQETMARFGTEHDAATAETASEVDIEAPARGGHWQMRPYFFDVLHLDGIDLIDEPLSARSAILDQIAGDHRIPATVTDDPERAEAVLVEALAQGHEGVMVKAVDGRYEAGRRGKSWRKVKPVYTYDLVVIGVERGNGRRTGTLSNLHLGARDPDTGEFVMVGKTFKGLTDEILAWQTRELGDRAISDDGYTIMVRPELVVEIAIDGVQRSTRYPGGVALRFARVKGYRPDRSPDSADTIHTLQSLL